MQQEDESKVTVDLKNKAGEVLYTLEIDNRVFALLLDEAERRGVTVEDMVKMVVEDEVIGLMKEEKRNVSEG